MDENAEKQRIYLILDCLKQMYPQAKCELNYSSPFQLLVAVILSAQCTDKRVNAVTPGLFAFAGTPAEMARHTEQEIIPFIHSCGFFNNKAHAIIQCSREIVDLYGGDVPREKDKLTLLTGVGNKSANVVFSEAFGGDAIAVDTHVFRVSNRLGLTKSRNPAETERQLCAILPKSEWSHAHHLLIFLGRYTCKAVKPNCVGCALCNYCQYFGNT